MFNHYSVFGALERVRTSGLPLRRRPLYPAELRVLMKDEGDETLIGDCEDVPLRRRPLYPAELWMRMKMRVQNTLIEMMGEFSEAGEPVPIRRRTLYPAELWVQASGSARTVNTVL